MTVHGPARLEQTAMKGRVRWRRGRRLLGRPGPWLVACVLAIGDQLAPSFASGLWVLSFVASAAGVALFRDIPEALERLRDITSNLLAGAGLLVVGFAIWALLVAPVVLATWGGGPAFFAEVAG